MEGDEATPAGKSPSSANTNQSVTMEVQPGDTSQYCTAVNIANEHAYDTLSGETLPASLDGQMIKENPSGATTVLTPVSIPSCKLPECDWYWGQITREEANAIMKNSSDGSFLIRDSSTKGTNAGDYTLTVRKDGANKLIKIYCREGMYGFNPAACTFHSMPELVEHFRNHSLAQCNAQMDIKLTHPMTRSSQVNDLFMEEEDEDEYQDDDAAYDHLSHSQSVSSRTSSVGSTSRGHSITRPRSADPAGLTAQDGHLSMPGTIHSSGGTITQSRIRSGSLPMASPALGATNSNLNTVLPHGGSRAALRNRIIAIARRLISNHRNFLKKSDKLDQLHEDAARVDFEIRSRNQEIACLLQTTSLLDDSLAINKDLRGRTHPPHEQKVLQDHFLLLNDKKMEVDKDTLRAKAELRQVTEHYRRLQRECSTQKQFVSSLQDRRDKCQRALLALGVRQNWVNTVLSEATNADYIDPSYSRTLNSTGTETEANPNNHATMNGGTGPNMGTVSPSARLERYLASINLDEIIHPTSLAHHDVSSWLVEGMERVDAEKLLHGKPDGTFMIRRSQRGHYALSVMSENRVCHCLVHQTERGWGFAEPFNIYPTLKDLVLHYADTSLEEHNDSLKTSLTYPVFAPVDANIPRPTTTLSSPNSTSLNRPPAPMPTAQYVIHPASGPEQMAEES